MYIPICHIASSALPQTDCKLSYKSAFHSAHTFQHSGGRGVALMQWRGWEGGGDGRGAGRSAIIELTGHTNLVSHRIN